MDNLAPLILGLFISALGIINIMGNISTIHSYNRRKVKEEDVPKYWQSCWHRNTYHRSVSCVRLHSFVLERGNHGVYHSSGSSSRIGIFVIRTVQNTIREFSKRLKRRNPLGNERAHFYTLY